MSSKTTTNAPQSDAAQTLKHRHGTHIVAWSVLFVLFAAAAVLWLLAAATMLLAEWTGSDIVAAAVLGGFLALLALCIYLIWIRPAAERAAERIETVCSVAAMTSEAFSWVREKYRFLKLLIAVVRRNW